MYSIQAIKSKPVLNLIKPFLRFKATTAVSSVSYDDAVSKIPGPSLLKLAFNHLPRGKYHNLEMIEFYKKLKDEYGSLIQLPGLFGNPDLLLAFEAEDFEEILRNEGKFPIRNGLLTLKHYRKTYRQDVFDKRGGLGTENDEEWYRTRKVANPIMMPPKTVHMYIPKIDEIVQEFITKIGTKLDDKAETPADFLNEINRWSLESIGFITLNTRLGVIDDNKHDPRSKRMIKLVRQMFELTYEFEILPSPWRYYESKKFKELMACHDGLTDMTLEYINEAIIKIDANKDTSTNGDKGVLESLLEVDKQTAIIMAIDMLMAGIDTTSSALSGLLFCLAKNPEKQDKLRQEIMTILPEKDSVLNAGSMKSMPYLRAALKESLRLFPVTVGTMRATTKDMVFQGYQVPKNSDVILLTMVNHKSEKHFHKNNEYHPERFLKEENKDVQCFGTTSNKFSYIPFGFGSRMCIGKRIAQMEIEVFILRFLREYKIEWHHPDLKFKSVLINIPDRDLKFKLIPLDN